MFNPFMFPQPVPPMFVPLLQIEMLKRAYVAPQGNQQAQGGGLEAQLMALLGGGGQGAGQTAPDMMAGGGMDMMGGGAAPGGGAAAGVTEPGAGDMAAMGGPGAGTAPQDTSTVSVTPDELTAVGGVTGNTEIITQIEAGITLIREGMKRLQNALELLNPEAKTKKASSWNPGSDLARIRRDLLEYLSHQV